MINFSEKLTVIIFILYYSKSVIRIKILAVTKFVEKLTIYPKTHSGALKKINNTFTKIKLWSLSSV